MKQNNVKIIGITGGVGRGKSAVLDYFQSKFNACVIQTDLLAHKLEQPGEICYQKIVEEYGAQILDSNGIINRKVLGEIVFKDEAMLKKLNNIVHPQVTNAIVNIISDIKNDSSFEQTKLIIIESALLFEAKIDKLCDETWYIYTNKDNRRKRLKESRGYSDEKLDEIMKSQLDEESFFAKCSHVIDNNDDIELTYRQIREELE